MTIGVTNFPDSLDDLTSLIRAVNRASSTLTSPIDATVDSVTVADASMAPIDGLFWIDAEAITFTSKTGNTLNGCSRGANGTVPASHSAGADVYFDIWAAAHHNVLAAAIVAAETKLGAGASVAAAGQFLKGTDAGVSSWGGLSAAEVNTALGYTASALTDRAEVLLLEQAFTNVASATFDNVFTGTYVNYRVLLMITAFASGATNQGVRLRLRSGGVTNSNSNYGYIWDGYTTSAAVDQSTSVNSSDARFGTVVIPTGAMGISDFLFTDLRNGRFPRWVGTTLFQAGTTGNVQTVSGWLNDTAYNADGLTVFSNSGNLSGSIWIYGLKAS